MSKQQWYVRTSDGQVQGPYTEARIRKDLKNGRIDDSMLIKQGESDWCKPKDVRKVFDALAEQGWYVKEADGIAGPFTLPRLKEMCRAGEVVSSQLVRRGKKGDWQTVESILVDNRRKEETVYWGSSDVTNSQPTTPSSLNPTQARVNLRRLITCPHCWHGFPPEDTHWVAEHASLLGDPRLGENEHLRFLPSRFNVAGNAIDAGGAACHDLGCPNCHLSIPRALLELAPLFVSIVGAPASGKTYFLAAMIQKLRDSLPKFFQVSIVDSDPHANRILESYVEQQFLNPNRKDIVRLAKTEEQGDLYSSVSLGDRIVSLPMPFLFTVSPVSTHPGSVSRRKVSRVVCLYDNAGESFLPGKDTGQNMVTRHLARSNVLMFLFDPTQDTRFRAACRPFSRDPQITEEPVTSRQETILHELAQRVRKHAGLGQNEQHKKPLIIVLTKYDAWSNLLDEPPFVHPFRESPTRNNWFALDVKEIQSTSDKLRELVWKFSPELVASAEAFSKKVLYLPASAFGQTPQRDEKTGALGISPEKISPVWCEVPILWTLSQRCEGLVPFLKANQPQTGPPQPAKS